jgi:uncharacterized repeat protein (TIGR02543 family)
MKKIVVLLFTLLGLWSVGGCSNDGDGEDKLQEFAVTFNANGGTISVSSVIGRQGDIISLPVPMRSGFEFFGWFTTTTGGTRLGNAEGNYEIVRDITMIARWQQITHTISFDSRGGTNHSPLTNLLSGNTITLPTPTKENYIFNGWFSAIVDGVKYGDGGSEYPVTTGLTMYAQWTRVYRITFNSHGGTSAENITARADTIVTLPTPSRTNFHFVGWFSAQNGGERFGNAAGEHLLVASATMHARWTQNTRTITFNTHGGDTLPVQTLAQNALLQLPTPVRSGYTFLGWFSAEIGGTKFDTEHEVTANLTMHARWTRAVFTISFNSQEGTEFSNIQAEWGTVITLPTPTYGDYVFLGWFSAPVGTQGTRIGGGGDEFTIDATLTMFARWRILHTIILNSHGGTGFGSIEAFQGDTITLPVPTNGNLIFDGWWSSASGGNRLNNNYTVMTNTTIHARWLVRRTITFNSRGGTNAAPIFDGHGRSITLPTTTREGFTFAGWFADATGGTRVGTNTSGDIWNLTLDADRALFAQWNSTITFDVQGGVGIGQRTQREGTTIPLPAASRAGYWFDGWYSAASGGELIGIAEAEFTTAENRRLFARWTEIATITFDRRGGMGADTPPILSREGAEISLPVLTLEGHTFSGWFSAPTGGVRLGNSENVYTVSETQTLFAQWTVNRYTVTFDSQSDTVPNPNPMPAPFDSVITLPSLTREGFVFAGWFSAATGGTRLGHGANNNQYPVRRDIIVFAQWDRTVTFNTQGGENILPLLARHGSTITTLPTPVREGFTFVGWFDAPAGDEQFEIPHTVTENVEMYARWRVAVNFNTHGGNNIATQLREIGDEVEMSLPTRSGHRFEGWFSAALDGELLYMNGDTHTVVGSTTFHARWTAMFTITFSPHGGNTVECITTPRDSIITLPTPTRGNLEFVGWHNMENGTVLFGAGGETHTVIASVIMHARWRTTVSFNTQGGDPIDSRSGVSTGAGAVQVALPTPAPREGYIFGGWFREAIGGTRVSVGGSNWSAPDEAVITLYARWQETITVLPSNPTEGQSVLFSVAGTIIDLVFVTPGTFTQGGTAFGGSATTREVTLTRGFWIGKYPVTQAQYFAVMGTNPSNFRGGLAANVTPVSTANNPVEQVSWNDINSSPNGFLSRIGGRLPTEAEWEFAARGGNLSEGFTWSGSNTANEVAWHSGNSGNQTRSVGGLAPNELGIYDMSGNVWEWVNDWWGTLSSAAVTDPTGPNTGSHRVIRGGGWDRDATSARVANRSSGNPDLRWHDDGFRVAFSPQF